MLIFGGMKHIKSFFAFTLLIATYSCREYKIIDSGYDSSIDFSKYKSFFWLPANDTANSPYDNSNFRNALVRDFTKQMVKHKYSLQTDSADFYLDLIVSYCNKTKLEDSLVPTVHLFPYYPGRTYTAGRYVSKMVRYVEDYVTINMIDRKAN
ncbi:MAG TPA: DUF4136 domain-containing protein, partial [Bacteroidia bacterium]